MFSHSFPIFSLQITALKGPIRHSALVFVIALSLNISGCALQPTYVTPKMNPKGTHLLTVESLPYREDNEASFWWTQLHDPAVDGLVAQALVANPTLSRAIAVVDQARAEAKLNRGGRLPIVNFEGRVSNEQTEAKSGADSSDQTSGSAGLSLVWELDLFGRVRNTASASQYRLDARIADAEAVRLSLIADVADAVVSLRACNQAVATLEAEIISREKIVALSIQRRNAGFDANIDVAISETGLATAQTSLALRRQDCAVLTNILIVLTGSSAATITEYLSASHAQPDPPPLPTELPAVILRTSPGVLAAEREVAAAWADIAVARAERLPRIDLTAALSGGWIRARGSNSDSSLSSLGVGIAMPFFDGGQGAAKVSASEARYAAAVAELDMAVRSATRDVENALSAGVSAKFRVESSNRAAKAAFATLKAREAQWRVGAVSQFEVEDARRQFADAQDSVIAAKRDAAQAWIALMRASGPTPFLRSTPPI